MHPQQLLRLRHAQGGAVAVYGDGPGIVNKTGTHHNVVQARKLVEQVGRPLLDLDMNDTWCILPGSFPNVFSFELDDRLSFRLEYPCTMINADVHDTFIKHQYQVLKPNGTYETKSKCSIYFELDGPYRCKVLPAGTKEGKLLKKRYVVFNFDGSLAELKGFELKRRGELELIKTFQSQVFEHFYFVNVVEVVNHWINIPLDTCCKSLDTN